MGFASSCVVLFSCLSVSGSVASPDGWSPHPDLCGIQDGALSTGTEMIDDLGHGGQPLSMADAATTFGQQWADLADSPSDGGTI